MKITAQEPFEVKPQVKSVHICMCGLSKNQPFCDGSHMKTNNEDEKKVYVYSDSESRKEVCDCSSDKKCDCGSACCEGK